MPHREKSNHMLYNLKLKNDNYKLPFYKYHFIIIIFHFGSNYVSTSIISTSMANEEAMFLGVKELYGCNLNAESKQSW